MYSTCRLVGAAPMLFPISSPTGFHACEKEEATRGLPVQQYAAAQRVRHLGRADAGLYTQDNIVDAGEVVINISTTSSAHPTVNAAASCMQGPRSWRYRHWRFNVSESFWQSFFLASSYSPGATCTSVCTRRLLWLSHFSLLCKLPDPPLHPHSCSVLSKFYVLRA